MIRAILEIKFLLITEVKFSHIYGSQDRTTLLHHLSKEAKLIIEVDHDAQNAFDSAFENGNFTANAKFYLEGWNMCVGGVKLQDSLHKYISNWVGKHKLRQYLYTKGLIA